MHVREDLPRKWDIREHVPVPMSDGVELSARLWVPQGAESRPVPAVLEYIPYRKRDMTRRRDEQNHGYFAGHGIAGVRVDLRGSGDSEGILTDEYLEQEIQDALEVLKWIADQPWCDGNVGMMGISWGGFNALQVAARDPPELKAIIVVAASDDRYGDDVHYMGGCLLGDNLSWASTMLARNSKPPDPEIVGEKWRELWLSRLEGSGLWLEKWLEHQHRDDYWKHGSVLEDYAAIKCPVLTASGWADGYTNAVFRLLSNLEVPRKGLVGPWSHKYPHHGIPGPAIGFLQEAVRWWDRWLKGEENGVDEEPMFTGWMQESMPPTTFYETRPGRWVTEATWPAPNIEPETRLFAPGRLLPPGESLDLEPQVQAIQSPLTVGMFAGKWCSYAATPDLPHDQREEDGGALVFESDPLEEDLEILGAPEVELELSSSRRVAMVAVRLSDVHPDDSATRITYGILNLTHHKSDEEPEYLEPGRQYRVRVMMNHIAQEFPKGHRVRVSISTSYFPLAWPPPAPVRLAVFHQGSCLRLPVRRRGGRGGEQPFGEPEVAPAGPQPLLVPRRRNWFVHRDLAVDKSMLEVVKDDGRYRLPEIDLEVYAKTKEWYSQIGNLFDTVRGETLWEVGYERGDWQVRTVTRTVLTSDERDFRLMATLDAYEGDSRIFARSWDRRIPRRLV